MAYTDHFNLADDYINHLDSVIGTVTDPFIKSRYTGFLSVSAVTVYELAIKDIFVDFSNKKHKILGNFSYAYFERINGRIKVGVIKDEYILKYGRKYVDKFEKILEKKENEILRLEGKSVKTSYANIITWRNLFAHEGKVPPGATYEEVRKSYFIGKNLIHCLSETMQR